LLFTIVFYFREELNMFITNKKSNLALLTLGILLSADVYASNNSNEEEFSSRSSSPSPEEKSDQSCEEDWVMVVKAEAGEPAAIAKQPATVVDGPRTNTGRRLHSWGVPLGLIKLYGSTVKGIDYSKPAEETVTETPADVVTEKSNTADEGPRTWIGSLAYKCYVPMRAIKFVGRNAMGIDYSQTANTNGQSFEQDPLSDDDNAFIQTAEEAGCQPSAHDYIDLITAASEGLYNKYYLAIMKKQMAEKATFQTRKNMSRAVSERFALREGQYAPAVLKNINNNNNNYQPAQVEADDNSTPVTPLTSDNEETDNSSRSSLLDEIRRGRLLKKTDALKETKATEAAESALTGVLAKALQDMRGKLVVSDDEDEEGSFSE
jgi:hypothetical protein